MAIDQERLWAGLADIGRSIGSKGVRQPTYLDKLLEQQGSERLLRKKAEIDKEYGATPETEYETAFQKALGKAKGEKAALTPGQMVTPEVAKLTKSHREEFAKKTGNFEALRGSYSKMKIALNRALAAKDEKSKAASDQALVIVFNKMLDPTSVVRESEYARTGRGQSVMATIDGFVEKVKQGGTGLTDENRRDVVALSRELLEGAQLDYKTTRDFFGSISMISGLIPEHVVGPDLSIDFDAEELEAQKDALKDYKDNPDNWEVIQ